MYVCIYECVLCICVFVCVLLHLTRDTCMNIDGEMCEELPEECELPFPQQSSTA